MTCPTLHSIRLARRSDLAGLVELAHHAAAGLTTLPADAKELQRRLEASQAGEAPLLVMVDASDEAIIGTAGLFTRVGDVRRAEPFYAYRIERSVHHSESLGVHHEVDALHLVKMFNGPTELGTLFLHPDHRGGGSGRVLSLSRFLLMFLNPAQFDRQVIAELRGVIDEQGHSTFWDGLGRHFFRVDFSVADALSARDKRFIAELMPPHPIYIPLLPAAAQAVIGNVHPETVPARRLLESEGFHFANMVDIFDAGPCLRCDSAAIRTIRQATIREVTGILTESDASPTKNDEAASASPPGERECLLATTSADFRATGGVVKSFPGGVDVSERVAATLRLRVGDRVCVSPLRTTALEFGGDRPVTTEQIV